MTNYGNDPYGRCAEFVDEILIRNLSKYFIHKSTFKRVLHLVWTVSMQNVFVKYRGLYLGIVGVRNCHSAGKAHGCSPTEESDIQICVHIFRNYLFFKRLLSTSYTSSILYFIMVIAYF